MSWESAPGAPLIRALLEATHLQELGPSVNGSSLLPKDDTMRGQTRRRSAQRPPAPAASAKFPLPKLAPFRPMPRKRNSMPFERRPFDAEKTMSRAHEGV